MTTLRVRGRREERSGQSLTTTGAFADVVAARPGPAIRPGTLRGEAPDTIGIGDGDVVELELADGFRVWIPQEKLREALGEQRGGPGAEIVLPGSLPLGPPTRGWIGNVVLKALRVVHVDVAEVAAEVLVAKLESKLVGREGLYHCARPEELLALSNPIDRLPAGGRSLVFIHGTASNTADGFGGLAAPAAAAAWGRLAKRYGSNIYAFEHRTLSQSPIENALRLAGALPEGAEIDLVSHSRGGLVGDLLCRAERADGKPAFDAEDFDRFRGADRARDLAALSTLNDVLGKARPRVMRYVRVACPAEGTTLASERLDLWLSVVVNAIGLLGLKGTPIYEFLSALVLAVAKKRTEPKEMPGIEAMMPGSPLVKMLNREDVQTGADLSVIAGDVEGEGIFGRLKILATDLFYEENHDLIVNTSAMVGGVRRKGGARFFFVKGAKVNHFHYFRNADSAERLVAGLEREDGSDAGYEPLTWSTAADVASRDGKAASNGSRAAPRNNFERRVLEARRRRDEVGGPPLAVSVEHGSVSFVREPVAVGHYAGDVIAGAERILDRHLDGRLTERRDLSQYAGPLGTVDVVLRRGEGIPAGVIVVGIGEVGALTPAALTRTIAHAFVRCAVVRAEEARASSDRAEPMSIGIAAVLIGSGRGGVSLSDSVRALVEGTLAARMAIHGSNVRQFVRIDRLRIVELYEDVAVHALRTALGLAKADAFSAAIQVEPLLGSLPGGRLRLAPEQDDSWWGRIQIKEDKRKRLAFTVPTDRARATVRLHPTQHLQVDDLVAEAISRIDRDDELAGALFGLLVPNDLKEHAPDQGSTVLLVDEGAARYPWELLQDPLHGAEPQAYRSGLIRQLATKRFRQRVVSSRGFSVLVVGDPEGVAPLPQLPGARREGEEVAAAFRDWPGSQKYDVTELVGADRGMILREFYKRPYRVMHLAGHGEYRAVTDEDGATTETSGMVLGAGRYLSPTEVEGLPSEAVPELVFVNCCHLGRIEGEPAAGRKDHHKFAANVATKLIRIGVRAVVAAGWAVHDGAALLFARVFYESMLAGQPFGAAVLEARRKTRDQFPQYNTWGAYQCYGDPAFRLLRSEAAASAARALSFVCESEVLVEIANVERDAATSTQDTDRAARGLARLAEIEEAIHKATDDWLGHSLVREALGRAYAQLGSFVKSIGHYDAARAAPDARYSVKMLEQVANLRCRQALARWKALGEGAAAEALESVRKDIQTSIDELERLPSVSEKFFPERRSLLGSANKRLSQIVAAKEQREKALAAMSRYYWEAFQAAPTAPDSYYPLLNWLAGEVLRTLLERGARRPEWGEHFRNARETAKKGTGFYDRIARADAEVLDRLADGDLDLRADEVSAMYEEVLRSVGAVKEVRSVLEHMDWLGHCLAGVPARNAAPGRKSPAEAIGLIKARLGGFGPS